MKKFISNNEHGDSFDISGSKSRNLSNEKSDQKSNRSTSASKAHKIMPMPSNLEDKQDWDEFKSFEKEEGVLSPFSG